jgi:RHS repeat-associated protein
VTGGGATTEWSAQSLQHIIGRSDSDGWSASTSQDAAGFLQYGPYTTQIATGDNVATWRLMIDNNSANNAAIVRLDVHDSTTGTVLASRDITRKQWSSTFQYEEFTLPFTLESSRAGHSLQFRVWWYDGAYVREQRVSVRSRANGGVTETYLYDADGERVKRVVGGVATTYFANLWEQTGSAAAKQYYTLNGQVIAMRDTGTNVVTYLHGDHLGSVSMATDSGGTTISQQHFDPWGKVRTGGIAQTMVNYTAQRLDTTGLLYYHARYYDPTLGRFVSSDSVVPGNASGSMEGVALKRLMVDFHEPRGTHPAADIWCSLPSTFVQDHDEPRHPPTIDRRNHLRRDAVRLLCCVRSPADADRADARPPALARDRPGLRRRAARAGHILVLLRVQRRAAPGARAQPLN